MGDLDHDTRVLGGGESGFVTTRFDALLNWARKYSLFQYPFATACCGMEFFAVAGPRYDSARWRSQQHNRNSQEHKPTAHSGSGRRLHQLRLGLRLIDTGDQVWSRSGPAV